MARTTTCTSSSRSTSNRAPHRNTPATERQPDRVLLPLSLFQCDQEPVAGGLHLCHKPNIGATHRTPGKKMNRFRIAFVALFPLWVALAGMLSMVTPVAAHDRVTVGEYELTVGWRSEPAVAGGLNGLDLGFEHHFSNGTTAWVVGIERDLNATLTTGPALVVRALEPQFDRPGWYTFDVIPTVPGAYAVRIAGRLNATTPVDVTVGLDSIAQLNAQLAALQTLLTILIGVALVAVLIGALSLVLTVRASRSMRRAP